MPLPRLRKDGRPPDEVWGFRRPARPKTKRHHFLGRMRVRSMTALIVGTTSLPEQPFFGMLPLSQAERIPCTQPATAPAP